MKKILTFAILLLVLFTTIVSARTITNNRRLRAEWVDTREVITVRVQCGDTLDKFGYMYKPTWMDVREYREIIKDLNGMSSSMLYANTTIKLYVQGGY